MTKFKLNLRKTITIVICLEETLFFYCNSGSKPQQEAVHSVLPQTETVEVQAEPVEVLGIWADDFTIGLFWRIIKIENGKHVLESGNKHNWTPYYVLTKTTKNGKVIFLDNENGEEYYRIEPNGDLAVFDIYGYITTFKKSK
jgi:hypothetical protein